MSDISESTFRQTSCAPDAF